MISLILAVGALAVFLSRSSLARRIAVDSFRHPFTSRRIDRMGGTLS